MWNRPSTSVTGANTNIRYSSQQSGVGQQIHSPQFMTRFSSSNVAQHGTHQLQQYNSPELRQHISFQHQSNSNRAHSDSYLQHRTSAFAPAIHGNSQQGGMGISQQQQNQQNRIHGNQQRFNPYPHDPRSHGNMGWRWNVLLVILLVDEQNYSQFSTGKFLMWIRKKLMKR